MPPNTNNQGVPISPSWFVGAPLSKLFVILTAASYLVAHTRKTLSLLAMDSNRIRKHFEFYRYWTSKLTFANVGELIVGGLLLTFLLRKFEREMGSRKFLLFCLFCNIMTIGMEMILIQTEIMVSLQYAGPYPLLGALFCLFHRYTPRLYPRFFGVLGFTFSEKTFYYLWFIQVILSGGYSTITPTAIGILAALFYDSVSILHKLDVPDIVVRYAAGLGERVSEGPPRILVAGRAPRAAPRGGGVAPQQRPPVHPIFGQQQQQQHGGAAAAAAVRPSVRNNVVQQRPPPDPAAIEQLVNMGFPRPQVEEALRNSNNDVNRAADRLLSQMG